MGHKNICITKGDLPNSLNDICPEQIAFLHLDLGIFPSEHDVLKILLPKITKGGIILFQSFGWSHYECNKIAKTPMITERNLSILELPT